jgi:hypothetical protein
VASCSGIGEAGEEWMGNDGSGIWSAARHYWTRAKAQKPSAKPLPTLGKEPSGNFESAKRSLPRALYRAHDKAFAEGKKNPRQRKTLGKM